MFTRVGRLLAPALVMVLLVSGAVGASPVGAARGPRHSSPGQQPHVWTPRNASTFNYPFAGPRARNRIRDRVLRAIRHSPRGSQIRIATFTFVDTRIADALIRARHRGVSVQLLVNRADIGQSPPYRRVAGVLGRRLRGKPRTTAARASFARTCSFSCRGTHGNLHTKIFLFSHVGRARWVSMFGSANLSSKASDGQWNTMDTRVDRSTYADLLRVFNQMKRDRVPRPAYDWFRSAQTTGWVFPRSVSGPLTDPTVRALRSIGCRAPAHTGLPVKKRRHRKHQRRLRRTVIRISMYAWFDRRGDYLAREVRRKWNQGCDVRIIYSVLNGFVKRTLYNPSGRGRIPMRRVVRLDPVTHQVVDYSHSKYIAVSGAYDGSPAETVWTGSMNFTGLGLVSDDVILRLRGHRVFGSYVGNFRRVWTSPYAKVPLPTGPLDRMRALDDPSSEAAGNPQLGSGPLAGLEQD